MKTTIVRLVVILALFGSLFAAAAAQAPAAPNGKPVPPPAMSETVKLRLELAQLADELAVAKGQLSICQGELAPAVFQRRAQEVAGSRSKIVADFEAANPGFTIDLKTLAIIPKKGGS